MFIHIIITLCKTDTLHTCIILKYGIIHLYTYSMYVLKKQVFWCLQGYKKLGYFDSLDQQLESMNWKNYSIQVWYILLLQCLLLTMKVIFPCLLFFFINPQLIVWLLWVHMKNHISCFLCTNSVCVLITLQYCMIIVLFMQGHCTIMTASVNY